MCGAACNPLPQPKHSILGVVPLSLHSRLILVNVEPSRVTRRENLLRRVSILVRNHEIPQQHPEIWTGSWTPWVTAIAAATSAGPLGSFCWGLVEKHPIEAGPWLGLFHRHQQTELKRPKAVGGKERKNLENQGSWIRFVPEMHKLNEPKDRQLLSFQEKTLHLLGEGISSPASDRA